VARQTLDTRLQSLRDALPGQVLEGTGGQRYPIGEPLGEGGQGWVFKASWNEPHGHLVVVKVLRPDVASKDSLARFQREAQVLRMLSQQARPNPYIVRFFDHAQATIRIGATGETWTLPFTVLEYVHGSTLEQVLADLGERRLDVDRARRLIRHIVLALEHVHAQNVVHRDLKPSNILVDSAGGQETAKVTDFGLVKLFDSNFAKTTALAGASVGYAPPEQFERGNARVGRHTDVFSLAAIVYEMLTGRPAFPFLAGDHPLLVLTRILNDARPALARVVSALPAELQAHPEAIAAIDVELARALSPDPRARHETMSARWGGLERAFVLLAASRAHAAPASDARISVARLGIARDATPLSSAATVFAPDADLSKTSVMTEPPVDAVSMRESLHMKAAASQSSQWTWRVRTKAVAVGAARVASIAPSGGAAVAAGSSGLLRWDGGTWRPIAGTEVLDPARVRAVVCGEADTLVAGELSLVARIRATGGVATWSAAAPDITHLAANLDTGGTATLVGERTDHRGGASPTHATVVIATESSAPRIVDVAKYARLRSVARVGPRTLIACGDAGALVAIVDGKIAQSAVASAADLNAIAALPDGSAVVAGKGGYVFQVWTDLKCRLEAIQTTRDLWAVAVEPDGTAWSAGDQARVLRRDATGWVRVGADVPGARTIIALWAGPRRLVAICDDGAVLEGTLR
jgi:serine/threonine protein kinase